MNKIQKYKWHSRRYWKSWFKSDIKKWYYTNIHGFNMGGIYGTIIPTTGETKYCSVKTKGKIIQIQHKHVNGLIDPKYDEIRIIPMKENHGIAVERFRNGIMNDRHIMTIDQFSKNIFASNVEQLTNKKI